MMKKFVRIAVLSILSLLTLLASVYAESEISCEIKIQNGYVYITGMSDPITNVSVVVFDIGKDKNAGMTDLNDAVYADQVLSGNTGMFEVKLKVDAEKIGIYKVYVRDEKGNASNEEIKIISNNASDEDKANFDAAYISLNYNGIADELELMQKVESGMGSSVVWSCESPLVTIQGGKAIIDRSLYEDTEAELKAKAQFGTALSAEKTFRITIKPYTHAERIEVIEKFVNTLTNEDAMLPTSLAGCTLIWSLEESMFVKMENGKLIFNRDTLQETRTVNLTCVVTCEKDMSDTKTFKVDIKPYQAEEKRKLDINELILAYDGTATEISLPNAGTRFGTEFLWTSSAPGIIEIFKGKAVVRRPANNTNVTLTAETAGGEKKTFTITVKGIGAASGGNSSSGGGSGASKGGTSMVMPSTKTNIQEYRQYPYDDMKNFEWASSAVAALSEKGIVNGTGERIFEPSRKVTRAEFAKMAALTFGYKSDSIEVKFNDVESGSWYEPYVAAMVVNGAIKGISEEYFGAAENISREDAAVIIYRCMKYTAAAANFADNDMISDYANEAVGALAKEGIIRGNEGRFDPKSGLSRAEAAVIINRCIDAGLKRVIEESDDISI